jgi:hypothetical protein
MDKHSPLSKIEFKRTPPTKFGLFIPRIPAKTTTVAEVLVKLKLTFPNIEVSKLILTKPKTKKDANDKEMKKAPSALIYLANAEDQDTILQNRWCAAVLSFEKPDIKPPNPLAMEDLTKNSFQILSDLEEPEMPPPKTAPRKKRSAFVGTKRKADTPQDSPREKKRHTQPDSSSFPTSSFDFTLSNTETKITDSMEEEALQTTDDQVKEISEEKRQKLSQPKHLISESEIVDLLETTSSNAVLKQNIEPVLSSTPKPLPKVQQTLHAFFTNPKEFGENKQ